MYEVRMGYSMTEDEACELLITSRAYYAYLEGWRIVTDPENFYGYRPATPVETRVLDKVKATVSGPTDPEVA